MDEFIIMDCHNHSDLSPDAEDTAEDMVLQACKLSINYYAVTDHMEVNQYHDFPEYDYKAARKRALELIPALQEKYGDKLNFGFGIELGQPCEDKALAEEILSTGCYDFVIGSLHSCKGYDDFYFLDYAKTDAYFILDLYFEQVLEMAKWGKFDVLGHLTYPLRYITGEHGIEIDMSRYEGIIKEIFKALIKNDCGIEINSSGLRQKIGVPMPNEYYVKMYYDLGGRILTLGSDAHRTEDLGKGIADCAKIAKKVGFKELTFFKDRKPQFIKL